MNEILIPVGPHCEVCRMALCPCCAIGGLIWCDDLDCDCDVCVVTDTSALGAWIEAIREPLRRAYDEDLIIRSADGP